MRQSFKGTGLSAEEFTPEFIRIISVKQLYSHELFSPKKS
jgi:hypothetical protein